ncbi:MAG TPA: NAD(P)/FAD-dependent oxidoreductase [Methylomirabilota bacterium]|jgi:putative flavoprotein involved in K+ transport|nr:NAD(P)/FAD-dependent oxidoreductase [Methylomirabilota bacterium]
MIDLPNATHTVVIGAGQAGLIMSHHLREAGREHLVLERREQLGGGWRDRWDGFQLVTPNFVTGLPGFPYDGGDPDGFMPRDKIAGRVAAYAGVINAPVALGTNVRRLAADPASPGSFLVETNRGSVLAQEVVVATGGFHRPRIPATGLDPAIHQLHAHDYRNEAQLPPGGVLLVGSGQTGVQLAEELQEAGRSVTLSVGHCGRVPRRYRDRDMFWWLRSLVNDGPRIGVELPSVEELPDPRARFACNPHLSGHGGGHDTNLRRFAAQGIRLVGRFQSAEGRRAQFAADLSANLAFADSFFDQRFRDLLERFAERAGLDLPPDDREPFGFEPPEVTQLDLQADGISTVMWTTGYAADYGWLDLPVLNELGVPRHVGGISEVPGLTFIGLLWQRNQASANFVGVASDADYLASRWT